MSDKWPESVTLEIIKLQEQHQEDLAKHEVHSKETLMNALYMQQMDYERRLHDQVKACEQSLLDQAKEHARLHDRHAALCVAILAGRWDEAARLARGDKT